MSSVQSAVAQRKSNTFVAIAVPTVYSLAGIQAAFTTANGAVNQIGSNFVVGSAANIVSVLGAATGAPTAPVIYQSLQNVGKMLVIQEDGTAAATVPFAEVKLMEVSYVTAAGVTVQAYVVTESSVASILVKVARA